MQSPCEGQISPEGQTANVKQVSKHTCVVANVWNTRKARVV